MDILKVLNNLCTFQHEEDRIIIQPNKNTLEHLELLLNHFSSDDKWEIKEDGSIVITHRKRKKYNRVYTSGCYDLFHYGHLNIFQKSKEQCNYLIVGVSTDDLILKEKGRLPVIPFEERVKIIESIKYVDEVIPQVNKNKQEVVDNYNIDAISVGDDWKGRYPKVTCDMIYIPYTKSVSSTILKDTLNLTKK
ncbi:adenylyltransferase/cytidyltransferase family protein [Plebeiibacterium sediminum]|uniref:Adenylyltransferase/cytidyltransferase family protein n=1 Tax=Plebeiibacterium sediminum TaxID=2992112 RepID=A0AAE3M724_9BACT|nr:adenylyltransferase/cytidyltransferase family protein [Plebeiobacterium sediminum]MCW3788015.1 adenylyltransferase/cytidyltransferase family protein [Plebeiobacterium sediminum]